MLELEQKLKNKTAIIGIIGLGYVGLPLAVAFANANLKVLGFDNQQKRVDLVNKGQSYINDISSESLSTLASNKLLKATIDQSRLKEVDAICICVPTPLTKTKNPDLSYVIYEAKRISKSLQQEQLVILESTTFPGTTREIVLPILEHSHLKVGLDFYLAYSPERINPGSTSYNIKNTPKIVGGIDSESTRIAELLYSQIVDNVIPVKSPEVAEMTKIFENVFRNVNIALVNELTLLCEKMGISVWDVIDAASTKPFGYTPFYPGLGTGGHCIPLDPYYLASKAREYDFHTRFIELAADINEQMPYYVTSRIITILNTHNKYINGAKVLILGVAYKKDIEDTRESPSLKLIQLLLQKGIDVSYNDPYISKVLIDKTTLKSVDLTDNALSLADCVVIATDHSCYDYKHIVTVAHLVFDTRGITKSLQGDNIVRM